MYCIHLLVCNPYLVYGIISLILCNILHKVFSYVHDCDVYVNWFNLYIIIYDIYISKKIKSNSVLHVKILVLIYLLICMSALFIYTRTIRHFAVEFQSFSFLKSFICVFVLYGLEASLKCDTLYNAFDTFPSFRRAVNKIRKTLTVFCRTSLYIT